MTRGFGVWRWLEVGLWALVLTLIWCVTATSVTAAEVGLAVAGGALCGVSAVLAREAYRGRWRVRARWVGWLGRLPGALLTDSVRVARTAVGRGHGELRTVPLPGDAPAAEQEGRRALAGLLISITPGGYLVDAPPDRTGLVLHVLGPPTGLERAVRR